MSKLLGRTQILFFSFYQQLGCSARLLVRCASLNKFVMMMMMMMMMCLYSGSAVQCVHCTPLLASKHTRTL